MGAKCCFVEGLRFTCFSAIWDLDDPAPFEILERPLTRRRANILLSFYIEPVFFLLPCAWGTGWGREVALKAEADPIYTPVTLHYPHILFIVTCNYRYSWGYYKCPMVGCELTHLSRARYRGAYFDPLMRGSPPLGKCWNIVVNG